MKVQVWHQVPGTNDVWMYPYLRKVDGLSSNSYIISAENQIALLDPGGSKSQMDLLLGEIALQADEHPRPVVAYLTHAHIDHCLQLMKRPKLWDQGGLIVAVQEMGANALENADARTTQADLLGLPMSRVRVDMELLSASNMSVGSQKRIRVKGTDLSLHTESVAMPEGEHICYQVMPIGGNDRLAFYHTPGHSPDSICIQAGYVLFIGDLLFATRPGVAGMVGWSQEDLLDSIRKVLWILDNRDVRLCCPGHGRLLTSDEGRKVLRAIYEETTCLAGIETIDFGWADSTARCAEDLMGELERLFAIIAGRLAFVAHVLGELEEERGAKGTGALIDVDLVDDLFTDLHRFSEEMHAANRPDILLVMKAGIIAEKLDQIFETEDLRPLLSRSLLRRTNRLLNDYSAIFRGFRPHYEVADVDLNQMLECLLKDATSTPYDEEAILAAETEEEYLEALKARIAHVNIFGDVNLILERGEGVPPLSSEDFE